MCQTRLKLSRKVNECKPLVSAPAVALRSVVGLGVGVVGVAVMDRVGHGVVGVAVMGRRGGVRRRGDMTRRRSRHGSIK